MMKRLSLLLLAILTAVGLIFVRPVLAFDPFGTVCDSHTQGSAVCQDKQQPQDAGGSNSLYGRGSILAKATFIISLIIGVVSVIVIIIAGLKFILAGGEAGGRRHGDPSGLNSARNTILYALIGIMIALSGQALVIFVINRL